MPAYTIKDFSNPYHGYYDGKCCISPSTAETKTFIELLEHWPVKGDLIAPIEVLPDNLKKGMGAEWRLKQKNQKILKEQGKQ